jgi:hypothetical protein
MVTNEFPIGQTLKAVSIVEEKEFADNELCLEQVKLLFENQTITLLPISDTDEIEIITEFSTTSVGETAYQFDWCHNFVEKKLMTVWVCDNDQGYRDQVIFAFGYLQPSIAFVAEGSVIKVFLYQRISKINKAYNDASNKAATEALKDMVLCQSTETALSQSRIVGTEAVTSAQKGLADGEA